MTERVSKWWKVKGGAKKLKCKPIQALAHAKF